MSTAPATTPTESVTRSIPFSSCTRLSRKWTLLVILLIFFAIAFALHHQGFSSRMLYDSVGLILEYTYVFARHDPLAVISLVPARPLFMLSLYGNYALTGMEPYYFRLFNALILAGSGLVLALLIATILRIPELQLPGTDGQKKAVGLFLGLVFVVHPLQSLVVLYVWQREAILSCFFYLSALAVYVAIRSGRARSGLPGYTAVALLFLGAILSKENAITLPIMLVLTELTLFRQSLRETLRRCVPIVVMIVPPLVLYVLMVRVLHGPDSAHVQGIFRRLADYYHTADLSPVEVILTQCRVLFSYACMILAPSVCGIQLVSAETISRSLWNPPTTLVAAVGVVTLVTAGIGLVRRQPLAAFGILFFLVSLMPESLLIPQYLFCGYRAILPMVGVLLIAGQLVLALLVRLKKRTFKTVAVLMLLVLTLSLATETFERSRNWSPLLVWKAAFEQLPPLSGDVEITPYMDVLGSYGVELSNVRDYDRAIEVLSQAADIDHAPNRNKKTLALVTMGVAFFNKGEKERALDILRTAVESDPTDAWAQYNLGVALLDKKHRGEALGALEKAVKLNPYRPEARKSLGDVLKESGRLQEAIEQYEAAAALDPNSATILNALGIALESAGHLDRAIESYRRSLELSPNSPEVNFNLAKTLAALGSVDRAIVRYKRAIAFKPGFGEANANLGTLLLRSGRTAEAIAHFRRAIVSLPNNPELFNQAGLAFAAQGDLPRAIEHFKKALEIQPDHTRARQNLQNITERSRAVQEERPRGTTGADGSAGKTD